MVTVSLRIAGFLGVLWENHDTRWYTRKEIAEGAGVAKSPTLVAILDQYVRAGKLEKRLNEPLDARTFFVYRIVLKQMSLPWGEE